MEITTLKGEAWLMKAKELYNLQQKIKNLEKEEKGLLDSFKSYSNYKEYQFGGMRCYYEERKGTVDYKSIPILKNIDLEQYRKDPVSIFKLVIDKLKG